jgi:LysM repeat protein
MKRISFFLVAMLSATPAVLHAQDAAVEERLNKLSAQIQDLTDALDAQKKRVDDLARQLRAVQDQGSKAGAGYASQDDLKQLATKLQEVDEKRQQDNERIVKELDKLGKALGAPASGAHSKPAPSATTAPAGDSPAAADKDHYEYTIQSGDSLSAIARAYNEKGIKVNVDQILKANPGLKPEKMRVGQKIIIPSPTQ